MQDATEAAATAEATLPLPVALPQGADASVRELAFAAQQYAKVRTQMLPITRLLRTRSCTQLQSVASACMPINDLLPALST